MSAAEPSSPPPAPALAARGLDTFYGRSHVLRGVDFAVAPGETVSLIGRNGMGKTTLLRSLVGLVRPAAGTITVGATGVTGARPSQIARLGIAFVPEGRGIFPNLTVAENLIMAARPGRGGNASWTLEHVHALFPRLAERRRHWGSELSGGEQKMLAIARALMTNPDVLLLDEATEGLAPALRDDIWQTLRAIRDAGIAAVVVDKNLDDLLALADRHVVLAKGSVVFDGPASALRADPDFVHRHLGV